jgi:hypothetical protein
MRLQTAKKFIEAELADLAVPMNTAAWIDTYENAIEAAEIMTKSELKQYIESRLRELPNMYFY